MRTVRLIVEYDGSDFSGWQIQANLGPDRTVQGALQKAVCEMTQSPDVKVRGASRTDAGVHARGQVAAFDTENHRIPLYGFVRGLSNYLPETIVVRHAEEVPLGWDPRRTSRGKRYRYTYWNDRQGSALDRHRAWVVRSPLDLERMHEGAQVLVGTHNFEAFRSAGCTAKHAIRTLYEVKVERGEYRRVHLVVIGNAFVRNMVRIIAGNLAEVGTGKRSVESLRALLSSLDRNQGAQTAPPDGLCLEEVIYDDRLPERPKDDRDLDAQA